MSELIKRITRVAGQNFDSHECRVSNPHITARESIELADYIVSLQAERDALAAQVVALIIALTNLHDVAAMCDGWESFPQKSLDEALDALNATTQHHLAAHDAEVAKADFLAGALCVRKMEHPNAPDTYDAAEKYAASLNK